MTDSLLERRRIEAQFAKAIFGVLAGDVGRERAIEILSKAAIQLACEAGAAFAGPSREEEPEDSSGLLAFARVLAVWQQDEALTIDLKLKERDRLEFDVKRCRYAEMYRELGIPELGHVLSCKRDGAFCLGFNPAIRLTRTQTIMEGAGHCDFRYALEKGV